MGEFDISVYIFYGELQIPAIYENRASYTTFILIEDDITLYTGNAQVTIR